MTRHPISSLKALAARFARRKDGVAAVEMGLLTPVLLLLFCGCTEIALLVRTHYKASQMATTMADVIARYTMVTSADVSSIMGVSAEVMGVSPFFPDGRVILTSVSSDDKGKTKVAWQCFGGQVNKPSRIGKVGQAAVVPGGITLDADDNVIVAEVYYQHKPMFGWIEPESALVYQTASFRPRLGSLTTAPGC